MQSVPFIAPSALPRPCPTTQFLGTCSLLRRAGTCSPCDPQDIGSTETATIGSFMLPSKEVGAGEASCTTHALAQPSKGITIYFWLCKKSCLEKSLTALTSDKAVVFFMLWKVEDQLINYICGGKCC